MLDVDLDTHLNTFHLSLDFKAEDAHTTVLLGESGAGKSTVLRLLAGLLRPAQGYIRLDDTIYVDSSKNIFIAPHRRPFGYVFQDYMLFPHLTVFENVAFGLRAQHLSRTLIQQRVGDALSMVHLPHLEKRYPQQLSGGQQQRVALARALTLQPRLLLLDEPLSALDVQTRREIRQELRLILNEIGTTTIMVTHYYLDALLFGDQILVLDSGKIIQQGRQQQLRESPRSSYIAELVGINFFKGRILRIEGQTESMATCVLQIENILQEGKPVEIAATLREGAKAAVEMEAYVVIDPKSITVHMTPPEGSARNIFHGTITNILPDGLPSSSYEGHLRLDTLLDDGHTPLTVEITQASVERLGLHQGDSIYTSFKASEASAYL
jgi:molybdate transport system ATP-binding protein